MDEKKNPNQLGITGAKSTVKTERPPLNKADKENFAEKLINANKKLVKAKKKITKISNLYAFISQVNQNIVRVKDEETLFKNACQMALKFGKFKMAWIGLYDAQNQKIILKEQCGMDLEDLRLFNNSPYQYNGPRDYVLRTGKYYIFNDIKNNHELEHWKPFAAKHGIRSAMVLPIKKSGEIIGTLKLYSTELNFAGKEEIKLLVEVSKDISFALELFEKEKILKETNQLIVTNEDLVFQNKEKEKRARELVIANKELLFESEEKEKRAAELIIANRELIFRNEEKEKRASELIIANKELAFQSEEKEKRAAELISTNKELIFRNEEKEKRASELIIANEELLFESEEKEKRAAELIIANKELEFQNKEKEKRAAELLIANKELAFQNIEKEKRAAELIIANEELVFQNEEKENRTMELMVAEAQLKEANQELESFSYSISHDLRAPLRAVNGYARILEEDYGSLFDNEGKRLLGVIQQNANRMGVLIDDLLTFSRLGRKEVNKTMLDMNGLIKAVLVEINENSPNKAKIKINTLLPLKADKALLQQVLYNLFSNAIKYSSKKENPIIEITSKEENGTVTYSIKDNGAGFDMEYSNKLFGVFQRLHSEEDFSGTGVGLAIVQRIINKHNGKVWAEGKVNEGATFFFSLKNNN